MHYREQLDGLRWFAALGVLGWHLLPFWYYQVGVGGGAFVHMFFVLSAFLATTILLRYRLKVEGSPDATLLRLRMYGAFQMRRVLRLFPIYYVVVICFALFWVRSRDFDAVWWHAAWLSNWDTLKNGFQWPMGHLWSLAIEQQFYLVWSILVLFFSLRWLPLLIVCLMPLAPLSRYLLMQVGVHPELVRMVPTSCLDAWGIGSLMACLLVLRPQSNGLFLFDRYGGWTALVLLIALFPYSAVQDITRSGEYVTYFPSVLAVLYGWLVLRAWNSGFSGFGGWLLSNPFSVLMGKISYGIYLFHVPVWWLTDQSVRRLVEAIGFNSIPGGHAIAFFLIQSAMSITIAYFSFRFFERRFFRFKDRFPYLKKNEKQAPLVTTPAG